MTTLLEILAVLILNYIFGCVVFACIDKDDKLLQWVNAAPFPTTAAFVVGNLWPVILALWFRERMR